LPAAAPDNLLKTAPLTGSAPAPANAPANAPVNAPAATPAFAGDSLATRVVLLGTMAVWGANLSLVKWLTQAMDPLVVSTLRMAIASLALAVAMLYIRPVWPRPSARQALGLVLSALLMLYLNQLCITLGLQRTAAANAALIIALNPLLSALMAAALLGDRLTPTRVAGVVLGFAGVSAVVLHRGGAVLGQGGLGDLLMFGAVLTWVSGGVLVQRLARGLDTAFISCWNTWLGTLMLLAHVAIDPGTTMPPLASLDGRQWAALVASGVLATAVGALVWNHALVRLGVARASLYAYWVPIFGVVFAVTLLGEPLSVWHGIGLVAVLGGTWLGTRR
jgi:drug/metabolite transporter (DMT)-like permease